MAQELERKSFLSLVRLGIGHEDEPLPRTVDWPRMKELAERQLLAAIVFDGVLALIDRGALNEGLAMEKRFKKLWIAEYIQDESLVSDQKKAADEMAELFFRNGIKTYVLKGAVIAECYPKPDHRRSVDMDCFLVPQQGDSDVWELGNSLIREKGYKVSDGFYKNSTFYLEGLTVENHRYLIPWRGNERLRSMEQLLQRLIRSAGRDDSGGVFEGSHLYRPPVLVSALFLVEHAYSHFLHEGLTWRFVLDWVMFKARHASEIDWDSFNSYLDEFGMRTFYDAYSRLGSLLMGDIAEEALTPPERRMLSDVWAPLDLHRKGVKGFRGKLALSGNTWRARWKYRLFTDISWLQALWIQTRGVLFDRNPEL